MYIGVYYYEVCLSKNIITEECIPEYIVFEFFDNIIIGVWISENIKGLIKCIGEYNLGLFIT